MRTEKGNSPVEATSSCVSSDAKSLPEQSCDKSDGWFACIAQQILPHKKAGTALFYITGFEERSCQRYVAGDTQPPGYFIRACLRSEQGWPFLCALMDGATPAWWVDLQTDRHNAAQIKNIRLR